MIPARVVVAVIRHGERVMLQLRDFDATIADPGAWGWFGGHLLDGENPDEGLRRELQEEIGWSPLELRFLGSFAAEQLSIIGFSCEFSGCPDDLVLREGQEIGSFFTADLARGVAFSARWEREFPLTPITRQALRLWRV